MLFKFATGRLSINTKINNNKGTFAEFMYILETFFEEKKRQLDVQSCFGLVNIYDRAQA